MTAASKARTRLIRPMSRETVTSNEFARSHWRKATRERIRAVVGSGMRRGPGILRERFHIITGLLLPIWDRLPAENMRVYRFETDDGERVIGRLVTPEALERSIKGSASTAPLPSPTRKPGTPSSSAARCSISPAICRSAARW